MSNTFSIGIGDNAPSPTWTIAFTVALGSDFVLTVTTPVAGQPSIVNTYSVSAGQLTYNAATQVLTWPITTAQSSALAYTNFYTLRYYGSDGIVEYTVSDRIYGINGPATAGLGSAQVPGLPGPPGIIAVTGVPLPQTGVVGQLALDGSTGLIYGPKAPSGWPPLPLGSFNFAAPGAGDVLFLF